MASRDKFDERFDEATLTKLEIFEKYLEEWLPTFIRGKFNKPIQMFDLFAGAGSDKNRTPGSPLRILKIIHRFRKELIQKGKKVNVFLNDSDKGKCSILEKEIEKSIRDMDIADLVEVSITNKMFSECITELGGTISYGCNLLFLDQFGFNQITKEIFQFLIRQHTTEFIFFISSSFISRFAEGPEVKNSHPEFDFTKLKEANKKSCHLAVCNEYIKYVPSDVTNYGLVPFSLMKENKSNVYGVIFVTKHILGADKFLDVVWRKNPINGTANYDIDDDQGKAQLSLFDDQKLTKIEAFQANLRKLILDGELKSNLDVYYFTINHGHIHQHADEVLRKLRDEGQIRFSSRSPLVNYEQAIKNNRTMEYVVLK